MCFYPDFVGNEFDFSAHFRYIGPGGGKGRHYRTAKHLSGRTHLTTFSQAYKGYAFLRPIHPPLKAIHDYERKNVHLLSKIPTHHESTMFILTKMLIRGRTQLSTFSQAYTWYYQGE